MAEGWGKYYLGNGWIVKSAGLEAHGINPLTIKVMDEVGIDISQQQSETICQQTLHNADLVVTLCGHAKENCPAIPKGIRKEHWDFPDPAKAIGTEEEVMGVFRHVRDDIKEKINEFAETNKIN